MGRTVLQMVNQAQRELGLPVRSTVVNNTDATTVQLFAFLQYALEEFRKFNDKGWVVLQKEYNLAMPPPVTTFGTVTKNSRIITNIPDTSIFLPDFNAYAISAANIPPASRIASVNNANQITMTMEATGSSSVSMTKSFGDQIFDAFGAPILDSFGNFIVTAAFSHTFLGEEIQFGKDTFIMPADIDWMQNYTWWDRTNHWMLLGPTSPQIDQWHRSGIVATGPRRFFRVSGQYPLSFRLWPPPFELVNPIQTVFEYMSRFAVQVQGNLYSFAEFFANDTDTCLLDDRVLIMEMKWRFWEQKGMNWASKRKESDDRKMLLMAQDGAAPTLPLARRQSTWLITPANVQDGYFPPGPGGNNPFVS